MAGAPKTATAFKRWRRPLSEDRTFLLWMIVPGIVCAGCMIFIGFVIGESTAYENLSAARTRVLKEETRLIQEQMKFHRALEDLGRALDQCRAKA